jgi:type IV pilus assembly protein PilA
MFCSKCGTEAGADAQFCSKCGSSLAAGAAAGPPDRGDVEYVEAAIGPRNTEYYLRKFARFSSGGGYASWNWPAFFLPLFWMLYRKMWLWAALYFFATPFVFTMLFAILFIALPETTAAVIGWTVELAAVFVVLPMYANALYYHTVQGRIAEAKNRRVERRRQLERLWNEGGTSNAAWVVALILPVPFIGILAAIAIPAYQDYTIRAQVSEGMNLAAAAKAAVAETFLNAGVVPQDREDAGMTPAATDTRGKYVSSVDVTEGRIDIVYGGEANRLITGRVLSITPYGIQRVADSWAVVWRCGYASIPAEVTHEISPYEAGTIEPKYLPSACRAGNAEDSAQPSKQDQKEKL